MITETELAHVESLADAADRLQQRVNDLELEVTRLTQELSLQESRRSYVDGSAMLDIFSRLYSRAQSEYRTAVQSGDKLKCHHAEQEMDALARGLNFARRVP